MTGTAALADHRATSDARLGLAAAVAAAGGLVAFVALPRHLPGLVLPAPLDVLWAIGAVFAVLVGPVVAGLSGWAGLVALWCHGGSMPQAVRRTHLITLVVVALHLGALTSPWGADLVSWWVD